jgi:hypothetical protein
MEVPHERPTVLPTDEADAAHRTGWRRVVNHVVKRQEE